MKAHIGFYPNKAQREEINKYVDGQIDKERADYIRRILKIVSYALHIKYGYKGETIKKLINFCNDEMEKADEAYWFNLDRLLSEHIGIVFENEDYNEREARAKELQKRR